MKGLTTLGGLAKGLKGGLKAMKSLKGMKSAVLGLAKRGRAVLDDAAQGAYSRLKNLVQRGPSDPIDMASGAMFLPQTDVELPGALPLVFSRRVESGYRAGWWFGPSWASTVDQHVETDDRGVVFASEDGMLLAYPHPTGSDAAVLPEAGPRWPLRRLESGGYTITDPITGHTRSFAPPEADGLCRIEQIADRNGHTIAFAYDEHGAPTGIHHSGGYHLKLTVDDDRITSLALAGAADDGTDLVIKRFAYDPEGNLTEDVNSSGLPLVFTYDERLRLTSWTDRNHSRYSYEYDAQDRCIAEGGEAGHVRLTLDYDGTDPDTGHRVTTVVDSLGHTWTYLVDDRSQIVAETDPLGHTTQRTLDDSHRLRTETDPLGRTVGLTHDDAGRVTSVTRPDGHVTRTSYDDLGLPTEVVEADGLAWRYTYDERGNRTSVTDPAGHTTRFGFDAANHLAAVTDAMGQVTRVRCNAAGLPVEVCDPLGGRTLYRRNAFGRPVSVTDLLGASTELRWTVECLVARRVAPDGTVDSWRYDGEGNCTGHTDAMGRETRFEYTHFDLLAARTGPDGARYEHTYDTNLQLTRVTGPQGLSWEYVYDPAGRLAAETDFDERTVSYALDAAGQVVGRTTALGETITYERDALGQVVRKVAAGQVTTYAYDTQGRLTRAAGPDSEIVYRRDELGRVTAETIDGRTTTHTYDPVGRRTGRVTPTGAPTSYYDAAGRWTTVTASGHELVFAHDAVGRETTRRIGESVRLASTWDPAGRLVTQTLTAGRDSRLVQQRSYTYRPDGYLAALDDHVDGRQSFTLDPAHRVTDVAARDRSESYAYDGHGNQTAASWPAELGDSAATGVRTYAGTRITRAGQYRYEHDDAGRLTLRQKARLSQKPDTWRFVYDAEDRLSQVTTPDGSVWRYRYDPLGRRTAKQRLSGSDGTILEETVFTWDSAVLIEETTGSGQLPNPVTLTWDHHGTTPIAQTERITDSATQAEIDARFFAIVTDLIGTPRGLVDDTGALAWRTRTTLWGNTAWAADSTAYIPLRLPGQYHDAETGLHYNLHRYYDPATARYTTPDPLGLAPAPNPAAYVHNPHTWTDFLGLAPRYAGGTGAGPADDPIRVVGPWTRGDIGRGAHGLRPNHLGDRLEIHHADQMPGSPIHELDQVVHRGPGTDLHRNRWNQGVTPEMRQQDTQLHWWYRSQEQGWGHYDPRLWYDNWPDEP
jgi:RHS repeat-associated protein